MNEAGNNKDISAKTVPGVVYFVRSGDGIKIGSAANFKRRLHALQTGSEKTLETLAVIPGLNEYEIHQRFAHLRTRGEWFRAEKELLDFIEYAKLKFGEDATDATPRAPKRAPAPPAPKRLLTDDQRQLKTLMDAYEIAQETCKGSLGLSLRKAFKAINTHSA